MGLMLIVGGIFSFIISWVLNRRYLRDDGLDALFFDQIAGTRTVRNWVSFLNLLGWGLIGVGILMFLIFGP